MDLDQQNKNLNSKEASTIFGGSNENQLKPKTDLPCASLIKLNMSKSVIRTLGNCQFSIVINGDLPVECRLIPYQNPDHFPDR
jgi:hypothetical protein